MKKILLLAFILVTIQSFGQNPTNYQYRTVRERLIAFMIDSSFHIPRYNGTPSGLRVGSSANSGAIAADTLNHAAYLYSGQLWRKIGTDGIKCGLTCNSCGLVVWSGTGLTFDVTAADYNLNGASYHFSGGSVTLDAADGTFDRFDAIVLTSSGLTKVTGTASSDPQLPQFDPCADVLLTYVFVQTGATTPTQISDELIYDENVETWTHATSGTISANFASTVTSSVGTKSIAIASWSSGANIIFTAPGALNTNNYTTFSYYIKLTAAMASNINISAQFFNGTTAVSNIVVSPFTKTYTSSFQGAVFSMSQFTFTSNVFTNIKLIFTGTNTNTLYIDFMRLQGGVVQPPTPTGLTNAYSRFTDGTNTATAVGGDAFKLRANLPLRFTVTNNDATHGDNILGSADTSVAFVPSLTTNARLQKIIDSLSSIGVFSNQKFGHASGDATPAENRLVNFTSTYDLNLIHVRSGSFTGDSSLSSTGYTFLNFGRFNNRTQLGTAYRSIGSYGQSISKFESHWNSGNPYAMIGTSDSSASNYFMAYRDSAVINLDNAFTSGNLHINGLSYNSDANLVSLVQDTTNGKIYRKTITGGGSDGLGLLHVVAGSGLAQVNDSTVRADTAVANAGSITNNVRLYNMRDSLVTAGWANNISNSNLTSTAAHTYNLSNFKQTITGGKWQHDSVLFTNTPTYAVPDSITAYGDSFTNPGNNTTANDSIYFYRMALRYFGTLSTIQNKGVSSRGIWRATSENNLTRNPGNTNLETVMAGFNDIRRNGDNRKTLNKIINGHQAIFINHFLKSWVAAGTGSGVTRYGTWTTTYAASTVGGKSVASGAYTQTINDSITWTFTGTNGVVSVIYGDSVAQFHSKQVEIYLDNVLQGTYDFSRGTDGVSDGADNNDRMPGGFIFSGLAYGSHKIKLIKKDANTHYLIVDYFGQLADLNNAYPLLLFHIPKMDATGYAVSPANATDAKIDTANAKIDSLYATFPAGYPVYKVSTNSYYTNTTASGDLSSSDHIHATDQGHGHIRDAAIAVYPYLPTTNGYDPYELLVSNRPAFNDSTGRRRLLAFLDELGNPPAAGSNKQVQYNSSGSIAGATGFEYQSGSSPNVLIQAQNAAHTAEVVKAAASQSANIFEVQSSTGTINFKVDAAGGQRTVGSLTTRAGGAGMEIETASNIGYVTAIDGDGSTWREMRQRAANFSWQLSGTTRLTLDANAGLSTTKRISQSQGADVSSTNNLVLGTDGNTFEITGTTQINLLSNLNWQNGSVVHLIFTSNPTVKNGQTTSTTNITILLAGAADFVASADDVLTLMLCEIGGTQAWREVSRSVN